MVVIQLLRSMNILVDHPKTVRMNNTGAIFMASKNTTMSCTKQVDIRYKYVNEYVDKRVVKLIFVKSTEK